MRTRLLLAMALLVTMATPAVADQHGEPFHVDQAIEIGRSAATNGLNGIYVSPVDGNVYNASVGGDEITIHDPETGDLLSRLGPESGVHGPDDLFITDDGTIYWTEILTGYVGMLAPGQRSGAADGGTRSEPDNDVRRRPAVYLSHLLGHGSLRARPNAGRCSGIA